VVCEETALVAAHAEVVYEEGAGSGRVCGGVEGRAVGSEDGGDVAVEVADFADDGAREVGGVGWEVREGLDAFGVLDLGLEVSVGVLETGVGVYAIVILKVDSLCMFCMDLICKS